MKAVMILALLAALAACGSEQPDTRAEDPAADPTTPAAARPTQVPAADGEVVGVGTVMDTGRPELCLGPVAESYPPQCGGPPIEGWDWSAVESHYDRVEEVRWGVFAVTGTFDGKTITMTEPPVPAPLRDIPGEIPRGEPAPVPTGHSQEELTAIAEEVGRLPGAQGAYGEPSRGVVVDVLYDDGSLQAWVDQEYGAGLVRVISALRPPRR
jgi:hypothetical protein